jgi:hypothetical protein
MLDDILENYPEFESHLSPNATIIKSQHFENAAVKIVLGREHLLTVEETDAVDCFKKEKWASVLNFVDLTEPDDHKESNPAKLAMKRAKIASSRNSSEYIDLRWTQESLLLKCPSQL